MPFCPNCHWEYIEGTKACSDCGSSLVDELHVEKFPEDIETAECYIADDEIEAEIVKDILHQNNIHCLLTSQYSHLVHPFSHIGASGQVAILVPSHLHDEALQIIKDYQAEKGVIDNEFNETNDEVDDFDEYDTDTDHIDSIDEEYDEEYDDDYDDYDDFDDVSDDDDDDLY